MRSLIIEILLLAMSFGHPGQTRAAIPADSCSGNADGKKAGQWARKLVPSQIVGQNAGNMGIIALGAGWDYGRRRQWETHFLIGLIPKNFSASAKVTLTLKENLIPWNLPLPHHFSIEPFYTGIYLNAIFGGDFWNHQPNRYPNNYYWFNTQIRTNVFAGQRLTRKINSQKNCWIKAVTAFYEVSSCDLYLIDLFKNRHITVWDALGLSVGIKLQVR